MPGQRDVVVLQEDDARLFAGEPDDARDDVLSGLVGGVRLTGEQDLHGPPRVAQQLGETRPVTQEQVGTLVRRKPAPETDGERVHVDLVRRLRALLDQLAVDLPKLRGRDLVDRVPAAVRGIEVPPIGADVAAEQSGDLRRDPRRHVHAVGDGADRHLRLRQSLPRVLPEAARDGPVEPAHADRLVREPQRGVRGAEPLARVARSLSTKVHEAVERDADLGEVWAEQIPHEPGVEVVAAGGDRRVRGEDDAGACDQARLLERHLSRRA